MVFDLPSVFNAMASSWLQERVVMLWSVKTPGSGIQTLLEASRGLV
jgi:hypothetical protein